MGAYLEVHLPTGLEIVQLDGDRVTLGKDPANDLAIDDTRVSRTHAVFERFPAGWSIRDLGSRNGTLVNGERITSERVLRTADEILVGRTRILYRQPPASGVPETEAATPPPRLTPRERDVLVAMCRPILGGSAFSAPASTKDIAAALVISEATVKEYLGRLYDRFDLHDDQRRRLVLANEALERGAVSIADLKATEGA